MYKRQAQCWDKIRSHVRPIALKQGYTLFDDGEIGATEYGLVAALLGVKNPVL